MFDWIQFIEYQTKSVEGVTEVNHVENSLLYGSFSCLRDFILPLINEVKLKSDFGVEKRKVLL